jgi:hypothetical protein
MARGWAAGVVAAACSLAACCHSAAGLERVVVSRKGALMSAAAAAAAAAGLCPVQPAGAKQNKQAAVLQKRLLEADYSKPLFSLPPSETRYPGWLAGSWHVDASFRGYTFPSKVISKNAVVDNDATPGFKQLSIMSLADIGPKSASFTQRFQSKAPSIGPVTDDRGFNLPEAMRGWLGEASPLVSAVEYDAKSNPNRCSFTLGQSKANIGASQIELFSNDRRSEEPESGRFLTSEYFRQVTVYRSGGGSGAVTRELVCDYQTFSAYKLVADGEVIVQTLTAGYLQPQDANFFESPSQPVVLYSHAYNYKREEAS